MSNDTPTRDEAPTMYPPETAPAASPAAAGESTLERADRALDSAARFEATWAEFNNKFDNLMKTFVSKLERGVAVEAPPGVPETLLEWHGMLGDPAWPPPRCVAKSTVTARPGYSDVDSSEYADSPAVLKAKVQILARMLRAGSNNAAYTGAGISTAAGIPDYASRAAKSTAVDPKTKAAGLVKASLLTMEPTVAHHTLAALERQGLLHFWLQQNHDGLAQKAGFPRDKVCEIHGSWHDREHNPVVKMSGQLRPDLVRWMGEWERRADVVIALGTSLCGMAADYMARAAARRFIEARAAAPDAPPPLSGLCIVNLQRTPRDSIASLRIFGKLDRVMTLLAVELGVAVAHSPPKPVPTGFFWRPESGEEIPDTRAKPSASSDGDDAARQRAIAKLNLTSGQRQKILDALAAKMKKGNAESNAQ